MDAKRFSLSLLFPLSALALLSTGCEITTCTGDEDCVDLDWDSGSKGGSDDDGSTDGGGNQGDGGADDLDAGLDSGTGDSDSDAGTDESDAGDEPESLTVEDFCYAHFAKAIAWELAIDEHCTIGNFPASDRDAFLQLFAYAGIDPVGTCITNRSLPGIEYNAEKAQACATAFASQFQAPPEDGFPDGIDIGMLEGTVGHGASVLVQIPACREAFQGTRGQGEECSDGLQCQDGLRCFLGTGDVKRCQQAIGNAGPCTNSGDCADGLTCVGSLATERVCRPSNDLGLNGANCEFSRECAEGLVCRDNKCVTATEDLVCK